LEQFPVNIQFGIFRIGSQPCVEPDTRRMVIFCQERVLNQHGAKRIIFADVKLAPCKQGRKQFQSIFVIAFAHGGCRQCRAGEKIIGKKNEKCFADTQPIIYKPLKFQSVRQIVKQVRLDWLKRKRLAKKDFSLRSFLVCKRGMASSMIFSTVGVWNTFVVLLMMKLD